MCAFAIGIDLGTTNSCVAVYKNGKVEIIQNEQDSYVIPSWVSFTNDGILAGHEAKDGAHKYIRNTVFEVKRLIGQRCGDEKIQEYIDSLPYEVVDDGGLLKIKVEYQGKTELYFPEEISAYVLQKLKDLAQTYLGQTVTKVVVTVPAYFNDIQREATKFAAAIAGFQKDDVRIINEPTAAALAFSYQNAKRYERNILVYDFGGGTFDVSIVTVGRGKCIVKATKGDLHLGGTDIDANLANHIKEDFKKQFGKEITHDDEATPRRLKNACETSKKQLSGEKRSVDVELADFSGEDYSSSISRQKFEELNAELFDRTMGIVEECLRSSGFTKDEIDEVVLVGGSSRIPKVRQLLKEYFDEDKINKGVNPDEAVAYGAAIHATSLVGNKSEVEDVISRSLGIAILGDLSSVIIPCNTPIPAKITKPYYTTYDNQEKVRILVFQGEEPLVKDNVELGQFILTDLRKAPAGNVSIDVCFEIDSEGILHVTASETGAENTTSVKIEVKKKGLTPEQWQLRSMEIEEHRQNELKKEEFLGAKHDLERLCNNVFGSAENIPGDGRGAEILIKCEEIREWLENVSINDEDELERKKEELEDLCASNSLVWRTVQGMF